MNVLYWVSFGALLIPTLLGLGWLIFRSWDNFLESIWYEILPDIVSLLRGKLKSDWMAELKLSLFIVCGLVASVYEKQLIDSIFKPHIP